MASPHYPIEGDGTAVESPGDRIVHLERLLQHSEYRTVSAEALLEVTDEMLRSVLFGPPFRRWRARREIRASLDASEGVS